MTLSTTVDATYGDDPANPSQKQHQQDHDVIHAAVNGLSGTYAAKGSPQTISGQWTFTADPLFKAGPVYDLTAFGGAGDLQFTNDAATTNGSTTVTSHIFTQAMVGKTICIINAAFAGGYFKSTIASVASSSSATMAAAATATVTGSNFSVGTDNTAAFNAAIAAIPNAYDYVNPLGGTILVPAGRWGFFGSAMAIPQNVQFRGVGTKSGTEGYGTAAGSVLVACVPSMTMFTVNASPTQTWESGFGFDGVNFLDVTGGFDNQTGTATGVAIYATNRWWFRNCAGRNFNKWISLDAAGNDCSWWRFDHCSALHNVTGIYADGTTGGGSGTISGGDFSYNTTGIRLGAVSTSTRIFGAKFDVTSGQTGIYARSNNINIFGNYFEQTSAAAGVDLDGVSAGSGTGYKVTANTFYEHGTGVGVKIGPNCSNAKRSLNHYLGATVSDTGVGTVATADA